MPVAVRCETCGKIFEVRPSRIEKGKGKYCSKECYAESLKGKHFGRPFQKGSIPRNKKPIPPKEKLERLYCREKWSIIRIATKFGVSLSCAHRWLKFYKIPRREISEAVKLSGWRPSEEHKRRMSEKVKVKISKRRLAQLREKGLTLKQIAKEFGVSVNVIVNRIREYNLPQKRRKNFISKVKLEELYNKQFLSIEKIAKRTGIPRTSVEYWMKKHGIQLRTSSEGVRIYMQLEDEEHKRRRIEKSAQSRKGMFAGEKNPMYGRKRPDLANRYGKREEFERKKFKALGLKPTKPEKRLIRIIKKHHLPLKYVGDATFFVGRKNPDFIATHGEKKVVELFGRVFHDPRVSFKKVIPYHQTYQGAIEYYKRQGYDALVIWDDEIGEEDTVLDKLTGFLQG